MSLHNEGAGRGQGARVRRDAMPVGRPAPEAKWRDPPESAAEETRTAEARLEPVNEITLDLFRPEAVEHRRSQELEYYSTGVVLAMPASTQILSGLVAAAVIGGALFAALGSYSRSEEVTGWIVPEAGLTRLAAQRSGSIEALDIAEGDAVSPGQPLASVRTSLDLQEGDAGRAMIREFGIERDADAAQARAELSRLELQRTLLTDKRRLLSARVVELTNRLHASEGQLEIAEAHMKRAEALGAKGFLPKASADTARGSVLSASGQVADFRAELLQAREEINALDLQLGQLPLEMAQAKAQAAKAAADLRQREVTAQTGDRFVVRSPMSGQVAALPVQRGQAVEAGSIVAVISPANPKLVAELYVPSRSAGFVKVGQDVRVKLDAFPYQKFGYLPARVTSVSRTVLAPNEVQAAGREISEPVFRLKAALTRTNVEAYGEQFAIRPGLSVKATIVLEKRSLLEWLFDPVLAVARRQ